MYKIKQPKKSDKKKYRNWNFKVVKHWGMDCSGSLWCNNYLGDSISLLTLDECIKTDTENKWRGKGIEYYIPRDAHLGGKTEVPSNITYIKNYYTNPQPHP